MVNLDQTQPAIPNDDGLWPWTHQAALFNRRFLTATMPKAFGSLMRILRLCPHANVGWPIRCNGEEIPSQHCFDCGAQRTYRLQPSMQRGPWKRPEPCSTYHLEIAFSSNVQSGSVPPEQLAIS